MITELLHASTDLVQAANFPDPGGPEAPPGFEGILKIMRMAIWCAFGVAVFGAIGVGAKMASNVRGTHNDGGGQHIASLGWVLAGCIVIGSASLIVNTVG